MTETEQATSTPRSSGSLLGRLLVASFMGTVVIAECLFAYFWLPSAADVAAQMQQVAKETNSAVEKNGETPDGKEVLEVEVDLGNFTITNHRLTEATFRTDFHLWGTVAESELDEFNKTFQRNKNRFRSHVIAEIRESEIEQLEEPGLGLIKRKILEKSNALFGKPMLRSVVFGDYTFVEL